MFPELRAKLLCVHFACRPAARSLPSRAYQGSAFESSRDALPAHVVGLSPPALRASSDPPLTETTMASKKRPTLAWSMRATDVKASAAALSKSRQGLHGAKRPLFWFQFAWRSSECVDKFSCMTPPSVRANSKLPVTATPPGFSEHHERRSLRDLFRESNRPRSPLIGRTLERGDDRLNGLPGSVVWPWCSPQRRSDRICRGRNSFVWIGPVRSSGNVIDRRVELEASDGIANFTVTSDVFSLKVGFE